MTTQFLEKHKISYETFLQYPGDIIYIKPGIFHQVVNLTPNIAEAINFGDAFWNQLAKFLGTSHCPENRYQILPANPDFDVRMWGTQVSVHVCEYPRCEFVSSNKIDLKTHSASHHKRALPKPEAVNVYCAACKHTVIRPDQHRLTEVHEGKN